MSGLASTSWFIFRHPGGGTKGLWRFFRWQIVTRLRARPTYVLPWVGGAQLAVRRGDHGLTGNVYCTLLEFDEMGFLLSILRSGDTFVDIGTNGGAYTVLAARVRGARVLAFEPVPDNYERLELNIRINGLEGLVATHPVALADHEGFGTMRVPDSPTAFLETLESQATDDDSIRVTTLDNQLHLDGPTILKIDVEGGEGRVINGAHRVLTDHRVLAALVEMSWDANQLSTESGRVVDSMLEFGFDLFTYDFKLHKLSPGMVGGQRNALFIRDEPAIQGRLSDAVTVEPPAGAAWRVLRDLRLPDL